MNWTGGQVYLKYRSEWTGGQVYLKCRCEWTGGQVYLKNRCEWTGGQVYLKNRCELERGSSLLGPSSNSSFLFRRVDEGKNEEDRPTDIAASIQV